MSELPIQIATLDDLRKLPPASEILKIRRGPAPIDNFLVHGRLHSIDGVWLNVESSMNVPLSPDSIMAKHYDVGNLSGATPEELLQYLKEHPDKMPRQIYTISYRLTGFQNKELDFPGHNHKVWTVNP